MNKRKITSVIVRQLLTMAMRLALRLALQNLSARFGLLSQLGVMHTKKALRLAVRNMRVTQCGLSFQNFLALNEKFTRYSLLVAGLRPVP